MVFRTAAKFGCKVVLQAGDLTDSARSWNILPRLGEFLSRDWGMKFYCVYGQHDTYMYSEETRGRTNMGVLHSFGKARILSGRPVRYGNVRFYGASWGQEVPKPKKCKDGVRNVLVIHAPIGPAVYPGHETTGAKTFLSANPFDLILCGDVHRSFHYESNKRHIINTGPLIRKWADEFIIQHRPHIWIYDSKTRKVEKKYIRVRAAAEVINREHLATDDDSGDNAELIEQFSTVMAAAGDSIQINRIIEEVFTMQRTPLKIVNLIARYMEAEDNADE
jgi:predicted phosphodiesterase